MRVQLADAGVAFPLVAQYHVGPPRDCPRVTAFMGDGTALLHNETPILCAHFLGFRDALEAFIADASRGGPDLLLIAEDDVALVRNFVTRLDAAVGAWLAQTPAPHGCLRVGYLPYDACRDRLSPTDSPWPSSGSRSTPIRTVAGDSIHQNLKWSMVGMQASVFTRGGAEVLLSVTRGDTAAEVTARLSSVDSPWKIFQRAWPITADHLLQVPALNQALVHPPLAIECDVEGSSIGSSSGAGRWGWASHHGWLRETDYFGSPPWSAAWTASAVTLPDPPRPPAAAAPPPSAQVTVHLLCHNERVLLPHTVRWYRRAFPAASIVVVDNESTDGSQALARELGCTVVSFGSRGELDERLLTTVRNVVWKDARTPWVIVADMDEWLCIDQGALDREDAAGTTVLRTMGVQMVGRSESPVLDDIDLASLDTGYFCVWFHKRVCFKRTALTDINFAAGAHRCSPAGNVRWSLGLYTLRHYSFLGLPWLQAKWSARHARVSAATKALGNAAHYSADKAKIERAFAEALHKARRMHRADTGDVRMEPHIAPVVFGAWGDDADIMEL